MCLAHGVKYFRSFSKFFWIFAAENSAAEDLSFAESIKPDSL